VIAGHMAEIIAGTTDKRMDRNMQTSLPVKMRRETVRAGFP